MYQIITALEGPIGPVQCIDREEGCGRTVHCCARKFWLDFHQIQVHALKATTLQSLLDLEPADSEIDFSI